MNLDIAGIESLQNHLAIFYKMTLSLFHRLSQFHYTALSQINQGVSLVYHPQLVAVYHQHEVLYIIKPQGNTRWRVMRYSPKGADDIRRTSCVNDIPSLRLG
jgi:hypothetical protein